MRPLRFLTTAIKLLLATVVVVAVALGWAASVVLPWALLREQPGVPAWAPWAASAAVFPCVPLLWHGLRERRVRANAKLRGRDRLVLRTVAVAGLSTALLGVVAPAQVNAQWLTVRGIARAHLPAPVLEWLAAVVPARDLVEFAPRDASWVVVGDLRYIREHWPQAEAPRAEEPQAHELEDCGLSLGEARAMFVLGPLSGEPPTEAMVAVQAEGLGREEALSCIGEAIAAETHQTLRPEWTDGVDAGWRRLVLHYRDTETGQPSTQETWVAVADADTLVAVTPGWRNSAREAIEGRASAADGPLRAPLARVSTQTPFWGVFADTLDGTRVDAGGSIELNRETVRWNASADLGNLEDAEALERHLGTLKDYFARWTMATSIVKWGEGEAWKLALDVRREGTLVHGDFVVGWEALLRLIVLGAYAL